jgi:hypothetical protein
MSQPSPEKENSPKKTEEPKTHSTQVNLIELWGNVRIRLRRLQLGKKTGKRIRLKNHDFISPVTGKRVAINFIFAAL